MHCFYKLKIYTYLQLISISRGRFQHVLIVIHMNEYKVKILVKYKQTRSAFQKKQ